MFKLPHNYAHFTCYQGNAQNPSSQASTVQEPRTSRCSRWIQKRQRKHIKLLTAGSQKKQGNLRKKASLKNDYAKAFDCIYHNKLWKILQEMGIPDHLFCLLRNLYAGQEETETRCRTTDCFQLGKGVHQGSILSPCLFNFYAE